MKAFFIKKNNSNEIGTIPIEHQRLVNKRIKKAQENPKKLLDWDIALKKLRLNSI